MQFIDFLTGLHSTTAPVDPCHTIAELKINAYGMLFLDNHGIVVEIGKISDGNLDILAAIAEIQLIGKPEDNPNGHIHFASSLGNYKR
jgi:hypothetical protein